MCFLIATLVGVSVSTGTRAQDVRELDTDAVETQVDTPADTPVEVLDLSAQEAPKYIVDGPYRESVDWFEGRKLSFVPGRVVMVLGTGLAVASFTPLVIGFALDDNDLITIGSLLTASLGAIGVVMLITGVIVNGVRSVRNKRIDRKIEELDFEHRFGFNGNSVSFRF